MEGDAWGVISESKKELISILTRYNSKKFIESIIAILDDENQVEKVLRFVKENKDATKTDIHEFIVNLKF